MLRCFSLGSASDLVSNCGVADKAGVAGSFLSGAFCSALVPSLSDPPPKAQGTKRPSDSVLTSVGLLLCAYIQA